MIFLNIAPPLLRQAGVMTRPALEQHDLIALLNWELAACNWLDARVRSDHRLAADERSIVRRVIAETRREFDLRPH